MDENEAPSNGEEPQKADHQQECDQNKENCSNGNRNKEQSLITETNPTAESCNCMSHSESDSDSIVISDSSSTTISINCSSDSMSDIVAQKSKLHKKRKREKSLESQRKNKRNETSSSSDSEEEKMSLTDGFQQMPNRYKTSSLDNMKPGSRVIEEKETKNAVENAAYSMKNPDKSRTELTRSGPSDRSQTPHQMAEAVFYFLGDGVTLGCQCSDGGLQEWEPNDDPWVEHAKRFPLRKLALKETTSETRTNLPSACSVEGQAMACAEVQGREELLLKEGALCLKEMGFSRADIRCAIDRYIDRTGRDDFSAVHLMNVILEMKDSGVLGSDKENAYGMTKTNTRNPLMHPAAQQLRLEGFSNEEVRLAINKYIEMTGCRRFKTEKLRCIIISMKEDTSLLRSELKKIDEGRKVYGDDEDDEALTAEALRKENEYLTEKLKCLICYDKDRCILYIPCGHRIVCEPCGQGQTSCSHCGVEINERIKTYLTPVLH